mmetsp:Transcript_25721/g.40289  ORF Transcript_25721/g.40289 Transcript_25721/m.40289 type:complete len:82 (+) Transcript_25721:153-398(+)
MAQTPKTGRPRGHFTVYIFAFQGSEFMACGFWFSVFGVWCLVWVFWFGVWGLGLGCGEEGWGVARRARVVLWLFRFLLVES